MWARGERSEPLVSRLMALAAQRRTTDLHQRHYTPFVRRFTLILLALLLVVPSVRAQAPYPDRIGERDFILDDADLLDEATEAELLTLCDTLLTEKKIPIIIVTIDSMLAYGGPSPGSIEAYAGGLFNTWGIGYPDYNYGMLLLVSVGDRRARIELGADWGRDHDDAARDIMDGLIIPEFKAGDFQTGIHQGAVAMDKLARGEAIPQPSLGKRMSRARQGIVGAIEEFFATMGRCLVFAVVLPLLIMARVFGIGGSGGGGGGGFSGGSFGGGFSGGGGASGSW